MTRGPRALATIIALIAFIAFGALGTVGALGALAPAADAQCTTDEPRTDRGGKIEWRTDIEEAMGEASRKRRPIVIFFTADW